MTTYPYRLSGPIGSRATLGLVVLQSDETIEQDFRRIFPQSDVALYVSRVPSGAQVTRDTLAEMEANLPRAASLFPPSIQFDAVGGCTSGTSVIGTATVAHLIAEHCTTAHVTEPVSALIAACEALKVSKLAFLSPYIEEVSSGLRDVLDVAGIASPTFGSFAEASEAKVARIDPDAIADAAIKLAKGSDAQAIFLSCTNLRTLDVIALIEAETGLPVLSSNQVLAWHMAKLSGLDLKMSQLGRLCA